MKLSVSLPAEDVAILDEFARSAGLPSRSAALRRAIAMLRLPHLEHDYEAAWSQWGIAGDDHAWEATAADGMTDVSR